MLRAAGIENESDLRRVGAAAAFVAVRRAGCAPSRNLLWALAGALADLDWREVAGNARLSESLSSDVAALECDTQDAAPGARAEEHE